MASWVQILGARPQSKKWKDCVPVTRRISAYGESQGRTQEVVAGAVCGAEMEENFQKAKSFCEAG